MNDGTAHIPQHGKSTYPILIPLPDHDFDPTEAAIPWKTLHSQGWKISFSTERGVVAEADHNKFTGPLPGLISASAEARQAYHEMLQDVAFQHPIAYAEIDASQYQAILLPGGDGLRMRQYLESEVLQRKVLDFCRLGKLIGAICHGILVLARTIDPSTGKSVLYGRKVTALPKLPDRIAFLLDSWFIKHGYIMYPKCVADEVRACLKNPEDYMTGSGWFSPYVVADGNLITSRYYLDAHAFANRFKQALEQS